MPRVHHVQSARKAQPLSGIAVGDSYYWWKFNFGPKMVSKTPPQRHQLTRSAFLSTVYQIEDEVGGVGDISRADLEALVDSAKSQIEDLSSETQGSLDNMPEGLQEGDTGQLLQGRIDSLEEWASELDQIEVPTEDEEKASDFQERLEDASRAVEGVAYQGE